MGPSFSFYTFISSLLFEVAAEAADVTAPRRCWVADNGNEPRKGEDMCTREKDGKQRGKEREREGESGEVGERGTRKENRNKNRSERTVRDVHEGELRGTGEREIKEGEG